MLLKSIENEKILVNKNKFAIEGKTGWEFYCDSYAYALKAIFCESPYEKYVFNNKSISLLFLIRHYVELVLKKYFYEQTGEILITHKLSGIFHKIENKIDSKNKNYEKLKNIIVKSNFNICDDGSCYRYLRDKNGRKYFDYNDRFDLYSFINDYNELDFTDCLFSVNTIFCKIDNVNKKAAKWNLTLKTGSSNTLFHIATQYDFIIDLLVRKIIDDEVDSKKIYLPLFFLIRHGVEINLKANLLKIEYKLSKNKKKIIKNDHSIEELYNVLTNCICKITKSKYNEIREKINELEKLKEILHKMDEKSYAFRFPLDKNDKLYDFKIDGNELFEAVYFYWELNSFMTFAINWLKKIGKLER